MLIRKFALSLSCLTFLSIFLFGCSTSQIVTGELPSASNIGKAQVGDLSDSLLGLFWVTLDTDNLEIEMSPLHTRSVSEVGDLFFDLEITDFMFFPYCSDGTCLKVGTVGFVSDGLNGDPTPDITFDITMKHPFAQYKSSAPVSGTNRADLDVFNPKVYIINAGNQDPDVTDTEAGKVTDTKLTNPMGGTIKTNLNFVQNPDGWNSLADGKSVNAVDGLSPEELATLLTYQIPTAYPGTSCHPFFNFFYGSEVDGGTNNPKPNDCRMSQGEAAVKKTVQLNIAPGEGRIAFAIAVSASFGQAAKGKDNRVPSGCKYFVPAFNTHNPIIVSQTVTAPNVGGSVNGSATIKVRDMQKSASTVAGTIDEYRAQADGGKLLPPEMINFANVSYPKITGLTMADYLVGANGKLVYRVVDSNNAQVIAETVLNGSTASGSGTAADPYVFTIPLPFSSFSAGKTYTIYYIVKDGLCDHSSNAFKNKWDFRCISFKTT